MLKAVICAACGAKVREDRTRCLRCGEPLRPLEPVPESRSRNRLALIVGAAALGVVVALVVARPAPDAAIVAASPALNALAYAASAFLNDCCFAIEGLASFLVAPA